MSIHWPEHLIPNHQAYYFDSFNKVRYEIIKRICGNAHTRCIGGARAVNPDGWLYIIRIHKGKIKISFPNPFTLRNCESQEKRLKLSPHTKAVFQLSDPDCIEKAKIFIANPGG